MFNVGKEVNIFTEVSDGQGDVTTAWMPGTVVTKVSVQPSFKAHGCESGTIVNVPGCAYKDKNVFVSDSLRSVTLRSS